MYFWGQQSKVREHRQRQVKESLLKWRLNRLITATLKYQMHY